MCAQLQAALELGRRASLPGKREDTCIKKTSEAGAYFEARLRGLADEHFHVAYLNLLTACRPMGIKVLDHIIVTEDGYYSFADSGLLDELNLETGV